MQQVTEHEHGDEVVFTHRQTSPAYDILGEEIHLPVNPYQYRQLIGRLLTHLDTMNLSDRVRRAARTLMVQELWRWWGEVYENATTSSQGCIAPIVTTRSRWPGDEPVGALSNRWGWASEQEYLDSRTTVIAFGVEEDASVE